MNPIFLNKVKVDKSWEKFLSKEIQKLIHQVETEVTKTEFTPSPEKVLRFLETPLDKQKIVILGQDPYPQPGVATGRAFEVGTLRSWNEPFKNISLKNIVRSLYQAYTDKTLKFNEIKGKLDNEFPLLPPSRIFSHWEKEGVLLLNTSFTCKTGKPGSHHKIWENFTSEVLQFLQSEKDDLTWFLWGSHAQEATRDLEIKNSVVSHHPMMCYDNSERKQDFLYGEINCFKQFIPEIDWTGYKLDQGIRTAEKLF